MALDRKVVENVAKLAAIKLGEGEADIWLAQLNDILGYIDRLQSVSTQGVVPTSHVHGVTNAFRNDVVAPSLSIEEALGNAPDAMAGGFRVPKII